MRTPCCSSCGELLAYSRCAEPAQARTACNRRSHYHTRAQTCTTHSGYWLSKYFPVPASHDWHHEVTHENFGTIGLMDNLFGTNKRFRARMRGELAVHVIGVDDSVQVDERWEDSEEEGDAAAAKKAR